MPISLENTAYFSTFGIFDCPASLIFSLAGKNKGNFLYATGDLVKQPCGSSLSLTLGVGVYVHCGADTGMP